MKRKMLSRMMAASLAAVMTVGLAGCGDDGNNNSSTPGSDTGSTNESTPASDDGNAGGNAGGEDVVNEDVDPYPVLTDANGNVPDLGGMEIIIRDWWSGDGERKEATDAYNEALYEYQDWAMEKYNFSIKQMTISGWGSAPEDFMNYVNEGGDDTNYIFVLRNCGEFEQYKKNGLMYDLSTLDCLDFSDAKWVSGVHNFHSIGNAIYAMRPISPEPRGGIYFNKRVLEEAGIVPDDIYTYQENGQWTWDKFEELCAQITRDTDNDGVNNEWAIVGFNATFYGSAVYSNNGEFVGKENGKYVNKLETNETMEALTWAMDMWNKYSYPQPEGSDWDYFNAAWLSGIGAFFPGEAYSAGQDFGLNEDGTYKFKDDFGFVCFPMGPRATDYTNVYNDNPYVIPACYDAQRAWNIAFALNVWTEPIPGYEDYNAMLNDYYQNFRDTQAVDLTLKRMTTNGRVTYDSMINGISTGNDVYWAVNENNSLAQQAEKIRNTWNYYIAIANGEDAEMPEELAAEQEGAE